MTHTHTHALTPDKEAEELENSGFGNSGLGR